MENNNRQNNRNNEDDGIMNKIGQAFENVVDAVTGDDDKNGQQKGRNNQNNR